MQKKHDRTRGRRGQRDGQAQPKTAGLNNADEGHGENPKRLPTDRLGKRALLGLHHFPSRLLGLMQPC